MRQPAGGWWEFLGLGAAICMLMGEAKRGRERSQIWCLSSAGRDVKRWKVVGSGVLADMVCYCPLFLEVFEVWASNAAEDFEPSLAIV